MYARFALSRKRSKFLTTLSAGGLARLNLRGHKTLTIRVNLQSINGLFPLTGLLRRLFILFQPIRLKCVQERFRKQSI